MSAVPSEQRRLAGLLIALALARFGLDTPFDVLTYAIHARDIAYLPIDCDDASADDVWAALPEEERRARLRDTSAYRGGGTDPRSAVEMVNEDVAASFTLEERDDLLRIECRLRSGSPPRPYAVISRVASRSWMPWWYVAYAGALFFELGVLARCLGASPRTCAAFALLRALVAPHLFSGTMGCTTCFGFMTFGEPFWTFALYAAFGATLFVHELRARRDVRRVTGRISCATRGAMTPRAHESRPQIDEERAIIWA